MTTLDTALPTVEVVGLGGWDALGRGQITTSRIVARPRLIRGVSVPPTQMVLVRDDRMAAAGVPAGAHVEVDLSQMAEPDQVVVATVALSRPASRLPVPAEVPARVVAYLRSDGDDAWLEYADGSEVSNRYGATICGRVTVVSTYHAPR